MHPRRLIAAWMVLFSSAALAELYSATVPIVQGNTHQARSEALKLLFLEAGQTGNVQVSSNSSLVGTELRETVRMQTRYRLTTFKITEETINHDELHLSALIEKTDQPLNTCPAHTVQVRNTRLKWLPSAAQENPENETLLKIAILQQLENALPNALLATTDNPTAAYTIQIQPSGTRSFFTRTLQMNITILGADLNPITNLILPFPTERGPLSTQITQDAGSATFKSTVLSDAGQIWAREISEIIAGKYHCLPSVAAVPPVPYTKITILTSTENVPQPEPTVFYSRQWPVKTEGQIDLFAIEGLMLVQRIEPKKITLETPKGVEGYDDTTAPFPSRGGYLLFH
jgi:hypothetical protein